MAKTKPKDVLISVRVPPDLNRDLKKLADLEKRSIKTVHVRALYAEINRAKIENEMAAGK